MTVVNILIRTKFFLVDLALWLFWGPFRKIVKLLPLSAVYFLATLTARVSYPFQGTRLRRICEELRRNCGKTHGPRETKAIALSSLEIYFKRHFEHLFMGQLTKEDLERMVRIEGKENIDNALEHGNGVIIQVSHFGSFILMLPVLGFAGYRINQLAGYPQLKHHSPIHKYVFNANVRENESLPITFLHVDKSIRPVINALKKNELVAMALDGRDGKDWLTVPFLGRPANLSPGSIRVASLTGAVILPAFMVRQPDDTHRLIIEKPFVLEQCEDKQNFLPANLARLAGIFGEYISKYPDHFAMTLKVLEDRAAKGIVEISLFSDDKEKA